MKVNLLITNIKQLLTLAGPQRARSGSEMNDLGIILNAGIAIKDDKIVAVGNSKEIESQYTADQKICADGKVVMPGFVDPHTHTIFVDSREKEFEMRVMGKSYVEISKAGGGIRNSIKDVREATEETLLNLAEKRINKMISMGTTTVETKSGYGLSLASELKMLRVIKALGEKSSIEIVATFMGAHEFPAEYKENKQEYIRILKEEMMPAVKEQNIAEYCDIFTEAHVFDIDQSYDIMKSAKDLGFKLRFHADEIEPIGGAELAAKLGAVSVDHLGACSDEGIEAMKKAGTIATLLPATIFSLGMKSYARARDMIALGLPVALATDYNPGSCNCDSMQFVTSLACLQMKMTPAEAICASTINAAYALERGDNIGSIEVGKQADILLMDMPAYQSLPFHLGSSVVDLVIKKGSIIFQGKS